MITPRTNTLMQDLPLPPVLPRIINNSISKLWADVYHNPTLGCRHGNNNNKDGLPLLRNSPLKASNNELTSRNKAYNGEPSQK